MKHILWFNEIKSEEGVGGKGGKLALMQHAEIPVPNGFVCTTALFDDLVKECAALPELQEIGEDELPAIVASVQEEILSLRVPESIQQELQVALQEFSGPVAVRSSAVGEDSADFSYAGIFDSFLNCEGIEDVVAALKKCYASLYSERALLYQKSVVKANQMMKMAVVVQQMVPAEMSGMMFTVNRVTGNPDEVVLEYVPGLCEELAAGNMVANTLRLDKATGLITHSASSHEVSLTPEQVQTLYEAGLKIEAMFEGAQDIEWALNGQIEIVQARPITTLNNPRSIPWEKIITRPYGVQYTEISIRSLTAETGTMFPHSFREQIYLPAVHGKLQSCWVRKDQWEAWTKAVAATWTEDNFEQFEQLFLNHAEAYLAFSSAHSTNALQQKTTEDLISLYEEYQRLAVNFTFYIWAIYVLNANFTRKAKDILKKYPDTGPHTILSPVKKARVMQITEKILKASTNRDLSEIYHEFPWNYYLDLHDTAESLEDFVCSSAVLLESGLKGQDYAKGVTFEEWREQYSPSKAHIRTIEVAKVLAYFKDLRDDYRRQTIFNIKHSLFSEIASRLHTPVETLSYLTSKEIVRSLRAPNIVIDCRERMNGFSIWIEGKDIKCAPGQVEMEGVHLMVDYSGDADDGLFHGQSGAPGICEGTAKIVKEWSEKEKVNEGDVLVAPKTDVRFLPAMLASGGIITEEGSEGSHAAIIASELGRPCVIGIEGATQRIKDGEWIVVDGHQGIVKIVSKADQND